MVVCIFLLQAIPFQEWHINLQANFLCTLRRILSQARKTLTQCQFQQRHSRSVQAVGALPSLSALMAHYTFLFNVCHWQNVPYSPCAKTIYCTPVYSLTSLKSFRLNYALAIYLTKHQQTDLSFYCLNNIELEVTNIASFYISSVKNCNIKMVPFK